MQSWLAARGTPRVCDCTLFRGRGTGASKRWRAWSGPDHNGLKVHGTKAPMKRRVRGGHSDHERAVLLRCIILAIATRKDKRQFVGFLQRFCPVL